MKPKVAEMENCHRILSETGGDEMVMTLEAAGALLRVARAVKEYGRIWAFGPSRQGVEVLDRCEDLDWSPEERPARGVGGS